MLVDPVLEVGDEHKRPPAWLVLLENWRALGEMSMLPAATLPLSLAPSGDGHSIIVCPGFLAGDKATSLLRRFLRSKNYQAIGWDLGRNFGPSTVGVELELLEEKVAEEYRKSGRKVSMLGWSLGGLMAREIGKRHPDMVRQVITLGSPVQARRVHDTNIGWLYERVAGKHIDMDELADRIEALHAPPAVPSTAIFTKTDSILPWRACMEPEAKNTDNIEVYAASHTGLGVNPFTYFAIADRLALPEDEWRPFDREAWPWRRLAYPTSGHGI